MGPIIELWVRPVRSDQVLVRADIIFSNYLDRFAVELFDHLNSPKQSQNVTVLTRWLFRQRASGLLFLDVLNSSSMLCTSAARAMVTTHSSPTHVTRYIYQHCSVQYPPLPVTWTLGRKPVGDLAKAIDLKLKCHVIEVIPTLKRRKFNEKMGWVPIW